MRCRRGHRERRRNGKQDEASAEFASIAKYHSSVRRTRVDDESVQRATRVTRSGRSRGWSSGRVLASFPPARNECHERTAPAVLCHEQYPGASPLIQTQTTTHRSSSWLRRKRPRKLRKKLQRRRSNARGGTDRIRLAEGARETAAVRNRAHGAAVVGMI